MAKTNPGGNAVAVVTSDSTDIDFGTGPLRTRGLYVGSGGDISVEMAGDQMVDNTVVYASVLSGTLLPIEITRVNLTLTTAALMIAIW